MLRARRFLAQGLRHPIDLDRRRPDAPAGLNVVEQARSPVERHAGVAAMDSLDFYCASFSNAYDLTIAGRCHGTDAPPASRADLYDRYIRKSLPQHASVVSALMRRLAGTMGDPYPTTRS